MGEITDSKTGEIVVLDDVVRLPENPSVLATAQLVAACERIFENREVIVENAKPDIAIEAMRRAGAVERYLKSREHKAAAIRALRVLETAVGEALGPAEITHPGKNALPAGKALQPIERHRFRRLAQFRSLWWPINDERPLSRKQALTIIDDALKQTDDPGETCTVDDLNTLIAAGKRFGTLYIDPPWRYNNQGTRAATSQHYKPGAENPSEGMTIEQIAAVPVDLLAATDSHLHLWTTNGFLFECPKLFAAWGFEFKSTFVWCKTEIGIGNYWRNSHEILLTAVRGDAKRFADKSLKSWIECGRGKHSSKPEIVRTFIERASPGPRIELFARDTATGWTVWGNDIQRTIFNQDILKVA